MRSSNAQPNFSAMLPTVCCYFHLIVQDTIGLKTLHGESWRATGLGLSYLREKALGLHCGVRCDLHCGILFQLQHSCGKVGSSCHSLASNPGPPALGTWNLSHCFRKVPSSSHKGLVSVTGFVALLLSLALHPAHQGFPNSFHGLWEVFPYCLVDQPHPPSLNFSIFYLHLSFCFSSIFPSTRLEVHRKQGQSALEPPCPREQIVQGPAIGRS